MSSRAKYSYCREAFRLFGMACEERSGLMTWLSAVTRVITSQQDFRVSSGFRTAPATDCLSFVGQRDIPLSLGLPSSPSVFQPPVCRASDHFARYDMAGCELFERARLECSFDLQTPTATSRYMLSSPERDLCSHPRPQFCHTTPRFLDGGTPLPRRADQAPIALPSHPTLQLLQPLAILPVMRKTISLSSGGSFIAPSP